MELQSNGARAYNRKCLDCSEDMPEEVFVSNQFEQDHSTEFQNKAKYVRIKNRYLKFHIIIIMSIIRKAQMTKLSTVSDEPTQNCVLSIYVGQKRSN